MLPDIAGLYVGWTHAPQPPAAPVTLEPAPVHVPVQHTILAALVSLAALGLVAWLVWALVI